MRPADWRIDRSGLLFEFWNRLNPAGEPWNAEPARLEERAMSLAIIGMFLGIALIMVGVYLSATGYLQSANIVEPPSTPTGRSKVGFGWFLV